MRVDLRVKHDVEARKAAIGLFELGRGYKSAAIALSLPAEAVRRWQEIYRAFGSEVLLRMDGKQGRYTYEQKVAAASAVVDRAAVDEAGFTVVPPNAHAARAQRHNNGQGEADEQVGQADADQRGDGRGEQQGADGQEADPAQ